MSEEKYNFSTIHTVSRDVLMEIMGYISTKPGSGSADEKEKKSLKVFSIRKSESGTYVVVLPRNLEKFTDNWPVRCAVAACAVLRAEILPSLEEFEEFKYLKDSDEYFHGIAAALKLNTITSDETTGLFHQGFRWVCSQYIKTQPYSDLCRTKWTNPALHLIGRETWIGNIEDHYKQWMILITEASKRIELTNPEKFALSFEQLNAQFIKHSFAYESGACFSTYEINQMKDFISIGRRKLEDFRFLVKNSLNKDLMSKFKDMYKIASSGVVEYDSRIAAIAAKRASIIFKPKKASGKKKISLKGYSREQFLELLSLGDYISATNPTGLFSDDRVEFINAQGASDEEATEQFSIWFRKLHPKVYELNLILTDWARSIIARVDVYDHDLAVRMDPLIPSKRNVIRRPLIEEDKEDYE